MDNERKWDRIVLLKENNIKNKRGIFMEKKKTSRAYMLSHIVLRSEIFGNWRKFNEHLNKGPEEMKKYLCDLWYSITNDKINQDFYLVDENREIKPEDFDITANIHENMKIFYIIFPDIDSFMAQAKCVALVLAPNMPRYITMEIANEENGQKKYMVGEWKIKDNKFVHYNYGRMEKDTIAAFSYCVSSILKADNRSDNCGLKEETLKLVDLNNISFKDLFSICIGKVYSDQRNFIEYVGKYNRWDTDVNTCILKLDDREFNVEYIGTTSPSADKFWYSSEIEKVIPDKGVELMIRTRKIMQDLNLNKFITPKIELNEEINGYNLSMIYIAFAPQNVAYFCGSGDTNIYMFVKDLPDRIFNKVGSNTFITTVMEIISNFNVNHKLMIKAFLIENGCKYIEDENKIIADFSEVSKITFTFEGEIFKKAEGNLN